MVNAFENNILYTVPEINALLKKIKETPTFQVVSKLPDDADPTITYYLLTGKTVKEIVGYKTVTEIGVGQGSHQEPVYKDYPEVVPYAFDGVNWYSVGSCDPLTKEEIATIVQETLNPSAEPVEPGTADPDTPSTGAMTADDVLRIWNSVPDRR